VLTSQLTTEVPLLKCHWAITTPRWNRDAMQVPTPSHIYPTSLQPSGQFVTSYLFNQRHMTSERHLKIASLWRNRHFNDPRQASKTRLKRYYERQFDDNATNGVIVLRRNHKLRQDEPPLTSFSNPLISKNCLNLGSDRAYLLSNATQLLRPILTHKFFIVKFSN